MSDNLRARIYDAALSVIGPGNEAGDPHPDAESVTNAVMRALNPVIRSVEHGANFLTGVADSMDERNGSGSPVRHGIEILRGVRCRWCRGAPSTEPWGLCRGCEDYADQRQIGARPESAPEFWEAQ